ncbi:MAG: hypothetical protein ACKVI4_14940 [Actinomycetales bacterium]
MSIVDFDRLQAIEEEEQRRTTDSGRAKPKSREQLGKAGFDPLRCRMLCEQNTVLFWAYELADAARLDRRPSHVARYHNHVRYMFDVLYLGDDRGFYNRCIDAGVPFWVRYAWLFAMLCFRDEDDLCLVGSVNVGLDDGTHGGKTHYGRAHCKEDYVDALLYDVPLVLADTPSKCVSRTERLHARFEDPELSVTRRVVDLDAHLFRKAGKSHPNQRKRARDESGARESRE